MTSISTEVYSTSYENQTNFTDEILLPGIINFNDSCEPDCHILSKPNEFDEDLTIRVLLSFAVIFLLATISIAVIFHRFQNKSQILQRRKVESLQVKTFLDKSSSINLFALEWNDQCSSIRRNQYYRWKSINGINHNKSMKTEEFKLFYYIIECSEYPMFVWV